MQVAREIDAAGGLKTRDWPETTAALRQMVSAAKQLREELARNPVKETEVV